MNSETTFLQSLLAWHPTERAKNNFKITIAFLAAITLAFTGGVWRFSNFLQKSIARTGIAFGTGEDGATDILIVGTDSRLDAHGNQLSPSELASLRAGAALTNSTDTIILLRIPKNNRSAVAISIPRDTYLTLANGRKGKINSIYGETRETVRASAAKAHKSPQEAEKLGEEAGRQALIKTIDNFMGVTIDHYAEIGLLGFILLTNAVGGVPVCLKRAVKEPLSGANFPAGKQKLSGADALSFVRQRHGLPRGDLDRIVRQQTYMASITNEILSAKTLTNPSKLAKLKQAVERSVIIDQEWDVMDFAARLGDLGGGDVRFITIPIVKENGWTPDGMQSIVQVDPVKVKRFAAAQVAEIKSPPKEKEFNKADYHLIISNSTHTDGLATAVAKAFTARGIPISEVNNYNGFPQTKNLLLTKDKNYPLLAYLQNRVNNTEIVVDSTLPDNTVTLVIGSTYRGPQRGPTYNSNNSNPSSLTADKNEVDSNCIN